MPTSFSLLPVGTGSNPADAGGTRFLPFCRSERGRKGRNREERGREGGGMYTFQLQSKMAHERRRRAKMFETGGVPVHVALSPCRVVCRSLVEWSSSSSSS